jgi:hypothetical protein
MHLGTSIGTRKAPVDLSPRSIAFGGQCLNMLPKMVKTGDAFGQTSAFKDADLDLSHVEPTAMFGRIMHLQSLPDPLRLGRRVRLVEAGGCMRSEIIHDQTNNAGVGIDLIDEPADGLREIQSGASLGHLDAAVPPDHRTEQRERAHPPSLPQRRHRRWECTTARVATASTRFFEQLAHRFWRDPPHIS